jgi:hypothetical protein
VELSSSPAHFRNLELAQMGLALGSGMVYPACSIRSLPEYALGMILRGQI